ncbi:hypothetical protein BDB01DRAFT_812594 [Pilobolus umbonatus]|nr:hypothetical protein BDB01DRAFT_812594 [Pilobolus umbonatus]
MGHYHVVAYLLDSNANIHQKDKDGWTALHNACSKGYYRIVRLLIERKAKVDVRSKMGHTPLINAASKGHMSIVEYLLDEAHANPLIKNNFGEAAYDVSAAASESYICEMLERSGRKLWHLQHTEGVLNPGNKRASMFGATYDLLEFHVTVIMILHENQRSTSLLGLSKPIFSENSLTKSDTRGPWSLHPSGEPATKESVTLPITSTNNHRISNLSNWFWLTDWNIDYTDPRVDPTSGWQYAKSFDDDDSAWTPVAPTSGYTWVRRRRWVRVMKRRMDLVKGSHRGENVIVTNEEENEDEVDNTADDYLLQADAIIQTVKSDIGSKSHQKEEIVEILNENIRKYTEAAQILVDAMKSDTNEFRKNQASTLVKSYLSHVGKIRTKIEECLNDDTVHATPAQDEPNKTVPALVYEQHVISSVDSNPWTSETDWSIQRLDTTDLFEHQPETASVKRVWEPNLNAKACRVCDKKFSLIIRRHHCRRCGILVCDKCSSYRTYLNPSDILQDPLAPLQPITILASHQQRVCKSCFHLSNDN